MGRKSTNNLNLTCGWANCRTTTVKRDHITSHIRVHVPLKPHKCEFCGKAFKRPQDLKKHVKTHADDSVLVRSPEPGAGSRAPNGMFGVGVGTDGKCIYTTYRKKKCPVSPYTDSFSSAAHYFEGSLGPVPAPGYAHAAPQYYHQPHQPHPANPSYGNVYYAVGNDATHQASYESKKRGYDALNEFFGDLKRRQFDTTSYAAVGQRLLNLHGLPLPLVNAGTVPEYQPMPAIVSVGGQGGYSGSMPAQPYQLPPMGNLRTKSDLMNIDQFLEQMQSTVYESDDHVAAAGVAQPGAHYVQGGMSYRASNSPPTATQLPPGHATATSSAPMMNTSQAARSPHSTTPALTPPSSSQSYTSGRSPMSLSSQNIVPSSHPQNHPQTSSSMYPTLPATTAQEGINAAYPGVSTAAPPSTLSSLFESDDRRRYTGGMLQRAHPVDPLGLSSEERSQSPEAKHSPGSDHSAQFSSLIDPALRHSETPSRKNSRSSATPQAEDNNERSVEQWVSHVRLIERLRLYIHERLERGEYENEKENKKENNESSEKTEAEPQQNPEQGNDETSARMEGVEISDKAATGDKEEQPQAPQALQESQEQESKGDDAGGEKGDSLYPVLKMDMDES